MRKAIQLKIILWIEALDEPAQDFAPTPHQVVETLIQHGAPSHPGLQITLKQVNEDLLSDSDAALAQQDAKPAEASQVSARIWVEGEDEPAHDFAQSTIAVLQEIIQQGGSIDPTRQVIVKSVIEDNQGKEEEEEEEEKKEKDEEESLPLTTQPAPPTHWFMRLQRWWASLWKE